MAAHAGESKKKFSNADRMPRDGLTGMGFHTQRHFIEVRQKMNDYLDQHQENGFDQIHHYPQEHHRQHLLNLAFLDGKRATKQLSSSSTSTKSDKHLAHLALNSTKPDHRHKKPSPRPVGPK